MRLLVIEDETALSEVIRAAFTDEKFEVDLAEDGETGYLLGSSGMYDAIILDGMLPEMDGYDVLRKWRQGQIHTPVLMLTARSELEDKLKGLGLGADDYLTKPFDMEELVARIRVITRRQGAVQIDYLGKRNSSCWSCSCAIPGRRCAESRSRRNCGGMTARLSIIMWKSIFLLQGGN